VEEWIPLTPGSSYMEDNFNTIWTTIGAKTPFANTCTCATLLDNGAGLSWDLSIPAHASVTVSHKTLFSIPPQGNPVSCLADAILVTERDALGGSGRTPYSESNATTAAVPGVYALPPGPWPSEPPTAQAHADARLHGVDYANALVGVSATTVYSKCDVNAVNDPGTGLNTDAYGIGGAEDLRLTILGNAVTLDALDFEMQAFGSAPGTNAFWTCDAADVGLNPPPPTAALCGGPGPVVFCTGLLATVCGSVTVTYNEVLGPTPLPGGRTEYQGSLVHVHVDPLVAGAAVTDVYLGYVDLVVTGGPFTAPPVYVPHAGCVTPVCT
jgi:hypothetical protein